MTKCPTTGCNQLINKNDLKDDKALEKKAQQAEMRQRRREAKNADDDDDAEMISD